MDIEELALKVRSLNQSFAELMARGDPAALDAHAEAMLTRRKLHLALTTSNVVHVKDKAAKDILRKIRSEVSEEQQAMEEILHRIEDQGTCGLLIEHAGDIDLLIGPLLYSWFSPRDYVADLFCTGAAVIRCSVPFELKSLVEEARQCFAFQQYNAVFSLCRTIIETAVTDIGLRIGKISQHALCRSDFYKDYPPWKRIDDIAPAFLRPDLHSFYTSASELIHGRKTVGRVESLEALRKTLQMIEQLYSHHCDRLAAPQRAPLAPPTPHTDATGPTPM